ncbi:MAG: hypothetical protein WCG48_00805 [Candidatus Berkelbacteria bacterium]
METKEDLQKIKQLLDTAENNIREAKSLLFVNEVIKKADAINLSSDDDIIEGVFDGENMIGPDSKKYLISANYASKSKLVTGDIMKLTVGTDGSYTYKQIGPVKRKKVLAELISLDDGKYSATVGNKNYRVLTASITFFKANAGDKITILIPEDGESDWAAVENVE